MGFDLFVRLMSIVFIISTAIILAFPNIGGWRYVFAIVNIYWAIVLYGTKQ